MLCDVAADNIVEFIVFERQAFTIGFDEALFAQHFDIAGAVIVVVDEFVGYYVCARVRIVSAADVEYIKAGRNL